MTMKLMTIMMKKEEALKIMKLLISLAMNNNYFDHDDNDEYDIDIA